MKALKNSIFVLTILLVYSCGSKKPDTKVPALNVQTSSIKADGIFDEAAWNQALVHHISDSVDLLVFQNNEDVFIGIKSLSDYQRTSTDLYIQNENFGPINLHSSMQLGERNYGQSTWKTDVNPYKWGNNEGWTANIFQWNEEVRESRSLHIIEKLLYSQGQEYVISKEKVPGDYLNLDIKINVIALDNQALPIAYPEGSTETDPTTWLRLELVDKKVTE